VCLRKLELLPLAIPLGMLPATEAIRIPLYSPPRFASNTRCTGSASGNLAIRQSGKSIGVCRLPIVLLCYFATVILSASILGHPLVIDAA
jgi:hypothetical protein